MPELSRKRKIDWVLVGAMVLLFFGYVFFHDLVGGTLFSHTVWDSYTLQALSWREGDAALSENYSWLELAVYNGQYYVSFPPVPSLVMLPLTFFFGEETPNNFVVMLYAMVSVAFAYECLKKNGARSFYAMFWAVFLVMGSNMLWMSTSGGVWFQAQGLNMALCFAAVWSLLCEKKALCMVLLALAVGCRPFSVCLLAAVFAYLCIQAHQKAPLKKGGTVVLEQAKYLIGPAVVAACYLGYNYARFHDPLEFGHNYLPEFSVPGSEQFGWDYFAENASNIFLQPVIMLPDGRLDFPAFNGFLFYLANPIFIVWFIYVGRDAVKKTLSPEKAVLIAGLCANLFLLLIHKTFGGWQFGARYTVDLLPFVLLYLLLCKVGKPNKLEFFVGGFAVLFNLYGALVMNFKEGFMA